jgi:hypothetical protein
VRNLTKGENGDAALEGRGQRNSELGMRNLTKGENGGAALEV